MYSVSFRVGYTPSWKRLKAELAAIGAALRPNDEPEIDYFFVDVPMDRADEARRIVKHHTIEEARAHE